MEQKYPIQFSLGQFVILFGVAVVLLGLSFFLGARFGDKIFPEHYAYRLGTAEPYQALQPQGQPDFQGIPTSNRLMNSEEETLEEEDLVEEENRLAIPHFQVDGNGAKQAHQPYAITQPAMPEAWQPDEEAQNLTPPPGAFVPTAADKHTVVRFKSSDFSKFSIEVAEYFDELLAAQRIRHLKEQGYEAYLHIENPNSRAPVFIVRVGAFSGRTQAESFATKMSNQEKLELRVVRVN